MSVALLVALLGGCPSDEPGPVDLLAPLPRDPAEALEACAREPFPELATTCRVEAAARAAGADRPEVAEAACAAIDDPRWGEECHFRAGEELARRGRMGAALGHCMRAGRYGRFCVTHSAWHSPPQRALDPADVAAVLQRESASDAEVQVAVQGAAGELAAEARDTMRARFWFSTYLGSGSADPAAARAAPPASTPAARTGFALEAVRLLLPREATVPADAVEQIAAIWRGDLPALTGSPLGPHHRHGRYHPPLGTRAEEGAAVLPQYGGGRRLVSSDPACDLTVATLEALYFRPETSAEIFEPWIAHECPEVRWTATRMVRVTPSATLDHEAVLGALVDHADPGVAAQASEGLRTREWTLFTGTPGVRP